MRRCTMPPTTAAFLCYDRHDDRDRSVSSFRDGLTAALASVSSRAIDIFQDRISIRWGENWRNRIRQTLGETPLLVPILTPNFLQSDECRDEVESFLEGEDRRRRWDLILPVYFYPIRQIDEREPIAGDYLVAELQRRQWQEQWIELRAEPAGSPNRVTFLNRLAEDLLARMAPVAAPTSELRVGATEQYKTIMAALDAAKSWDRVVITEGTYREAIAIDRPVEIVGEGNSRNIVIEWASDNTISVQANQGRIANVTVRHVGGRGSAIKLTGGRLVIEDADVTSSDLSCISIQGGAWPSIRNNRIHGGNQEGVYIGEGASGTIEDNDIYENRFAGIAVRADASPKVRRNRIHNGAREGIYVGDHGRGVIDDNVVRENALAGIYIERGGAPILRATNHVYSNGPGGGVNVQNLNT
jgi:parallel beta-helix repeat protein